jgi:hypothetical protein
MAVAVAVAVTVAVMIKNEIPFIPTQKG